MSERAPYSRVYWSIVDDPKFASVYDDDKLLATWLRLLILADQSHPASPSIPLGTNVKALTKLVDAGLIDRGTGFRFRVHGLDAERVRRRPPNAGPPPVPDPDAPGPGPEPEGNRNGTRGLRQAEQSKDETSTDTSRAPDPAQIYWNLTGRYPRDKALSWIDDLASSYGPEPVIRALAKTHIEESSVNTLLGRTEDVLRAEARTLSLKEQAHVRTQLKERRAEPPPDPEAVRLELEKILRGEAA